MAVLNGKQPNKEIPATITCVEIVSLGPTYGLFQMNSHVVFNSNYGKMKKSFQKDTLKAR